MIKKLIVLAIVITSSLCFWCNISEASTSIPQAKVKETIVKNSIEMGVDPALALSIAKHESKFCHESKSHDGAVGVFQVKPSTARKLGYNPYTLNGNIKCALHYYKLMYNKFGSMELALAAYNAGPGNVVKYKGMPPFKSTKNYVNSIMKEYKYQKANPDIAIKNAKKATQKPVQKQQPVAPVQQKNVEENADLLSMI